MERPRRLVSGGALVQGSGVFPTYHGLSGIWLMGWIRTVNAREAGAIRGLFSCSQYQLPSKIVQRSTQIAQDVAVNETEGSDLLFLVRRAISNPPPKMQRMRRVAIQLHVKAINSLTGELSPLASEVISMKAGTV